MKLTDTQMFVLRAAADHPEGAVFQFPDHVKGNARHKVLEGLVARGLIAAHDDGHVLTEAGRSAIGRETLVPTKNDFESDVALTESGFTKSNAAEGKTPRRSNSKQSQVIALLKRPEGATIAQLCEVTGWLPHTLRGTLAGTLKKKQGFTIVSEKTPGGIRTYRIV